jgi:regulator of protease activity HflC (stomatin/prohibitin superfamily)
MGPTFYFIVFVIVFFMYIVINSVRVLNEWERGILLRLGRYDHTKLPGLRLVWPVIDRMIKMDLRVITMDVPKQDMMTRDNVPVSVDAVIYFQVINPEYAYIKVENFVKATSLRAQTTLRSVIGQAELDELLAQREKINLELQTIIDEQTEPWGIKVTGVEVKEVALPDSMKRAMAKQAEAERERRAKVVNAEGEFQAAEKMVQAAAMIAKEPIALQLRYLQTMREMASEHNTTTFLPLPIDLFSAFLKK